MYNICITTEGNIITWLCCKMALCTWRICNIHPPIIIHPYVGSQGGLVPIVNGQQCNFKILDLSMSTQTETCWHVTSKWKYEYTFTFELVSIDNSVAINHVLHHIKLKLGFWRWADYKRPEGIVFSNDIDLCLWGCMRVCVCHSPSQICSVSFHPSV